MSFGATEKSYYEVQTNQDSISRSRELLDKMLDSNSLLQQVIACTAVASYALGVALGEEIKNKWVG